MRRPSRTRTLAGVAALGVALTAAPVAAGAPAADASSIRPLAVGAATPAVEVRAADGEAVDLRALLSRQPTVLIFYRGGW